MEKDSKYLPGLFGNNCFGCGDNPSGLRMKFTLGKDSVISMLEIPQHLCGWEKFAHGGVISAALDEVMSWTALYLLKKLVMTKEITVECIKPVAIGSPIKVEGRVIEQKNEREVLMEGILYGKEEKKLARSTAVFAVFSPRASEKLGLVDGECLDRFEMLGRGIL